MLQHKWRHLYVTPYSKSTGHSLGNCSNQYFMFSQTVITNDVPLHGSSAKILKYWSTFPFVGGPGNSFEGQVVFGNTKITLENLSASKRVDEGVKWPYANVSVYCQRSLEHVVKSCITLMYWAFTKQTSHPLFPTVAPPRLQTNYRCTYQCNFFFLCLFKLH